MAGIETDLPGRSDDACFWTEAVHCAGDFQHGHTVQSFSTMIEGGDFESHSGNCPLLRQVRVVGTFDGELSKLGFLGQANPFDNHLQMFASLSHSEMSSKDFGYMH